VRRRCHRQRSTNFLGARRYVASAVDRLLHRPPNAQANTYLDKLTRDEYRALYHATQRLSKLALERLRLYTDFPDELPYDDLAGDARNPD
jgi:hypothetical protein